MSFVLGVFAILQISIWQSVISSNTQENNCYCLQEIVSNIYSPTAATILSSGDRDDTEVLVVEQRGIVKRWKDGDSEIFMDIRDRVYVTNETGDSRGLLSMALSPDYHKDHSVFVYYIRKVGEKQYAHVSKFVAPNGKVDASSEVFLLRVFQPYKHGNGGPMFFDDDGFLYIVVGDGGATDDTTFLAQNKESFHGSILRIDPNGQDFTPGQSSTAKPYAIPKQNPFINNPLAKGEIFAFGFRNPWGCSLDSKRVNGDGRIFCVDTGTDQFDEVNIVKKGKNYGWPLKEGSTCLKPLACGAIQNEGLPAFELQHTSHHALVGGYVYRGKQLPWMREQQLYTFADIISGETFYLQENKTSGDWQVNDWPLCELSACPSDAKDRPLPFLFGFSQDDQGELYFLMVDKMNALVPAGKMYKVMGRHGVSAGEMIMSGGLSLFLLVTAMHFWSARV